MAVRAERQDSDQTSLTRSTVSLHLRNRSTYLLADRKFVQVPIGIRQCDEGSSFAEHRVGEGHLGGELFSILCGDGAEELGPVSQIEVVRVRGSCESYRERRMFERIGARRTASCLSFVCLFRARSGSKAICRSTVMLLVILLFVMSIRLVDCAVVLLAGGISCCGCRLCSFVQVEQSLSGRSIRCGFCPCRYRYFQQPSWSSCCIH
jgi:hypothetical protein